MEFCNTKLLGTLGSCVLIDEDTKKEHQEVLEQAVTDMEYGGIAVNTIPPFIFLSPYLTWGGNEEGREFVSGHGNFGNLLCYDNLGANMARYAMAPTWMNLTKLMAGAVVGNFKHKDF